MILCTAVNDAGGRNCPCVRLSPVPDFDKRSGASNRSYGGRFLGKHGFDEVIHVIVDVEDAI